MRQAGRYLPEYNKIKDKAGGFINLLRNPDLACEVTLQPLKRFNLDAAIIFSDILVVAELLNLEFEFIEKKGPVFFNTITTKKDLGIVPNKFDISKLNYVFEAIKLVKNELNNSKPLIGFIGSPWTVATYVVEGNSTKKFNKINKLVDEENPIIDDILSLITNASIEYVQKQIDAGIDIIMIFDTWSNLLTKNNYQRYSLSYINKINEVIRKTKTPIIYYSRNTYENLNLLKHLDVDVVGINSDVDIKIVKKNIGERFALQGNLDVKILKEDNNTIKNEVKKILNNYGIESGHIFNLGTGITPDIKPEKVALLVDFIQNISPEYHL
tara:strand:- start:98391 stop:99368 length:978 start_codon:yes stop_codon:yes gene_type:complete